MNCQNRLVIVFLGTSLLLSITASLFVKEQLAEKLIGGVAIYILGVFSGVLLPKGGGGKSE